AAAGELDGQAARGGCGPGQVQGLTAGPCGSLRPMIDRLSELEGRVQSARAALEGLAERAARLRARLEATNPELSGEGPPDPEGAALVAPDVDLDPDAPAPAPETSALASSLERLSKNAWVPVAGASAE